MKVGIVGSGTMGSGIAQVAATAGCEVFVFDVKTEALEKSAQKLEKILNRLIEKERIDENEKERIQSNIKYVSELKALSESDLIIEAIIENLDIKQKVFTELESYVSEDCILASNTSSLSITSIASACEKSRRFIGIHFFNPAPLMKLVEIIPAIQTEKATTEKVTQIIGDWKKHTVLAKDTPGFIVNKVARPFYSEALRIFEEGITQQNLPHAFATIDWAMTKIGGFRMGPFTLMDFIGNDVNYTVTETVWKAFYHDPRYAPAFTQKRLSEAGYHGKKAGRGYYDYSENAIKAVANEDECLGEDIAHRIIIMLINEAADTLHRNIASMEDIDKAMTKGVNYPKGLFKWADELGIDTCVSKMDELYEEYHEDRYRCSPLLRKMSKNQKTFYS